MASKEKTRPILIVDTVSLVRTDVIWTNIPNEEIFDISILKEMFVYFRIFSYTTSPSKNPLFQLGSFLLSLVVGETIPRLPSSPNPLITSVLVRKEELGFY